MAMGRGDILEVRRRFTTAILSAAVLLGACLGIVLFFRIPLAGLLSANGALRESTLQYLSLIVIYSTISGFYSIIKLFTSMSGRPRLVMISALIQMLANLIFDLLFVKYGLLGIRGLSLASILSVLIGLGILIPNLSRSECPFAFIRVKREDFFKLLVSNVRYGSAYLGTEVAYILFYFSMNTLALRFLGERGTFCWSVVMMIYLVAFYAVTAAQETCISLGGKYLGASDETSVKAIFSKSSIFASLWIIIVLSLVILFPEKLLPLFGTSSVDASSRLIPVILCAVPFIFGSSMMLLPLIHLVQRGQITRFTAYSFIIYLSIPLLFVAAHLLAPGKEWMGFLALPFIYIPLLKPILSSSSNGI